MKLAVFSPEELQQHLVTLNAGCSRPWSLADGALVKTFRFADFSAAFAFMTRVALAAEKMDHHPDWTNVWNRVDVRLSTHDAGGITEKDFALAVAMERVV